MLKVAAPHIDASSALDQQVLLRPPRPGAGCTVKVFTWQKCLKVHVTSTAIYSFLTIKMLGGRNVPFIPFPFIIYFCCNIKSDMPRSLKFSAPVVIYHTFAAVR